MKKYGVGLLVLSVFFTGCATVTGSSVSRQEIEASKSLLEVRALEYQIKQVKRVNEIGYHLVQFIPQEDINVKPRPFLGLFCIDRSKVTARLFNQKLEQGVFIAFVLENTPADSIGLKSGDVVLAINKNKVNSNQQVVSRVNRLKAGSKAVLTVLRDGRKEHIYLSVEEIPVNVRFSVVDAQSVNAAANSQGVVVTYGLLNFAKSDDEIAAVIGHELGHFSRGHIKRLQGGQIVTTIVALGLGATAEVFSPGSGDAVVRGMNGIGSLFSSKFSRDLEREADYFGVKYIYLAGYDPEVSATFHERFAIEIPQTMISSYLSSHPSSPERPIRIKKIIEELRAGH